MKKESYGLALTEKQLKFIVKCIEMAQKTEWMQPELEESERIRRLGKKYEELIDDEYSEYDLRG